MLRLSVLIVAVCVVIAGSELRRYFLNEFNDVASVGEKPTFVSEFGEGIRVAQQFIAPRDGLAAVDVAVWSDSDITLDLQLELIRAAGAGEPDRVVGTSRSRQSQSPGVKWYTFHVTPISPAKGRTFVAWFSVKDLVVASSPAIDTPRRSPFGLMAWADDALPSGKLFVGNRERWGDLAFTARSDPPTRLQRMAVALGPFFGTSSVGHSTLLVIGTIYSLLLIAVTIAAFASRRSVDIQSSGTLAATGPRRWPQLMIAVILAVGTPTAAFSIFAARERVAVDLLHDMDRAHVESPMGIHAISVMEESINGYFPKAVFAHPPSRVVWTVTVPVPTSTLRTAIALRPYVWEKRSDGATFTIAAQAGAGASEVLFTRYLNPRERLEDRAWIEVELNLTRYAGRQITLVFETAGGPGGDPAFDWAMWAHPRIVKRF